MTEAGELRERIRALEVQYTNLVDDMVETRAALAEAVKAASRLQASLDAVLNQGKGATLVLRIFVAVGGIGWLAGVYAAAKQLAALWRLP